MRDSCALALATRLVTEVSSGLVSAVFLRQRSANTSADAAARLNSQYFSMHHDLKAFPSERRRFCSERPKQAPPTLLLPSSNSFLSLPLINWEEWASLSLLRNKVKHGIHIRSHCIHIKSHFCIQRRTCNKNLPERHVSTRQVSNHGRRSFIAFAAAATVALSLSLSFSLFPCVHRH